MTRRYYAAGTGWQPGVISAPPPENIATVRLTHVSAEPGTGTPPPPVQQGIVFGYNPNAPEGDYFASSFGRTPIARCYRNNDALPADGSDFQPGGFAWNSANKNLAGHVSGQRINMSVLFDPATVTNANSPKAVELRNYAASVPAGWQVQVVLYHEYNLHTTDYGGNSATGRTSKQFTDAFPILADAIATGDAGRGRCTPVINPSWGNGAFNDVVVPNASLMPQGTQLHFDVYNNPSGNPPGYKGYGTGYRTADQIMKGLYAAAGRLGYLTPGYGWGIDEFGAPRRVAPRLAALNSTYGWGPSSPFDLDGSGMARAITDFANWCINAPVKPTTVIFFTGEGVWNQSVKRAGTIYSNAACPGRDAPPGDPLHQGWPIDVDPSLPLAAYKHFIDISA